MKKYMALVLVCLYLTGCTKNLDNIPSLALVQEQGADWAQEKLVGYGPDALREIWGEPDGTLSGFWGEQWFTDADHNYRVTVYYDGDGKVETVRMDTAPGFEPASEQPEPEPEPVPEPVDLTAYEEPPGLTVLCGEEELETVSPGYTWVSAMPNGERAVLCACGPHPLGLKEKLTVFQTAEETALLQFELEPDAVYVHAWDDNSWGAAEIPSQSVTLLEGGDIELLPGGYIYEVSAEWGDGESSGGTGTYVFYIDKLYPGNE